MARIADMVLVSQKFLQEARLWQLRWRKWKTLPAGSRETQPREKSSKKLESSNKLEASTNQARNKFKKLNVSKNIRSGLKLETNPGGGNGGSTSPSSAARTSRGRRRDPPAPRRARRSSAPAEPPAGRSILAAPLRAAALWVEEAAQHLPNDRFCNFWPIYRSHFLFKEIGIKTQLVISFEIYKLYAVFHRSIVKVAF